MRRLLNDLSSILMAFFMALFIWIVAEREANPVIKGPFPYRIPLEIINKPPDVVVLNDIPAEVDLTIKATRDRWSALRREDFHAWIDLQGKTPGYYQVDVQASSSDRRVDIVEIEPAQIMVHLEKWIERKFTVRIEVEDSPPLGYHIAGEPEADPPLATVSGPEPFVGQVVSVVARLRVSEAKETFTRKVVLEPVDENGNPVENVSVKPPYVTVKVPIEQRAGFRDVSVLVKLEGNPAPGYRITSVSVNPSLVTLVGIPALIDDVPGYVETEPVNIEGARESVSRQVKLNLPVGISALGVQSVRVEVEITPIEGGLTLEKEIEFQGLKPGLEAKSSPETVSVILAGPLPELENLNPEDVRVVVDLRDLGPGTYKVEPKVVLPEGLKVESLLPNKVEVVISKIEGLRLID